MPAQPAMSPSLPLRCKPAARVRRVPRGAALIEALIAMLLIAVWMLSSAGLQIGSMKMQQSSSHRFIAVALAGELGEAIEANTAGANAGHFALAARNTALTSATDCRATFCTPQQLATYNLAQWSARVVTALPVQDMAVVRSTTADGLNLYTITVRWRENPGRSAGARAFEGTETMSVVLEKVVRNATP